MGTGYPETQYRACLTYPRLGVRGGLSAIALTTQRQLRQLRGNDDTEAHHAWQFVNDQALNVLDEAHKVIDLLAITPSDNNVYDSDIVDEQTLQNRMIDTLDKAQGLVRPLRVPPRGPPERRQLQVPQILEWFAPPDELGLVRAVDALGHGVVVRVADRAGRGKPPEFPDPSGVHEADALHPMVAVAHGQPTMRLANAV